jgi:hypothetical protein
MLINSLDDLPSTAEITPGTISIDRKAIGVTSWSSILSDAACSEIAGLIYYDEVFDSGTGYAEGDSIRVTFKSQKITVAANDYEIIGATGRIFYTEVRQSAGGAPTVQNIVDGVFAHVVDTTMSFQELCAVNLAALAGKSSGGGTATLIFRDEGDTKPRITATVDASGNRTAITLDGS